MGRHGVPDVVVACAGVSVGTLTEYAEDLAVFRRVMDTNVFGMAATFAPFIPAMKAAGGRRRLAGIASVSGIRGLPGAEAYSASKAAAIAYLESLRLEMRPYGIPVVTITPGYIATPMTAVNPYSMPFLLPADIRPGDYIEIGMLGAYGAAMKTRFNGFGDGLVVDATDEPMASQYCGDRRDPRAKDNVVSLR